VGHRPEHCLAVQLVEPITGVNEEREDGVLRLNRGLLPERRPFLGLSDWVD
jgi:hypothetical protein